jgi:hypothetical protein
MNAADRAREDEEFLAKFEPAWMRGPIRKLMRIHDRTLAGSKGLDVEAMSPWALAVSGKLLDRQDARPARPAAMTVRAFGKILGQNVCVAKVAEAFVLALRRADDASRAKLTKFLGGPCGVKIMQDARADLAAIEPIRNSVLKRIRSSGTFEQGHFYRGFGEGLTMLEQKLKRPPKTADPQGYMVFFAVMHWKEIERRGQLGGWPSIADFFVTNLPDDLEISQDAFVKMLQRAGLSGVGRQGRPRKLGQQSSRVSMS